MLTSPPMIPLAAGIKVLAVDDDADTRILLTCASAAEAWQSFQTTRPDILVLDLGMPKVDGYSLLQQIRATGHDAGAHTPAIALTAYGREKDRQTALANGFQAYIAKPMDIDKLLETIGSLIPCRH